MFLTLGFSLFCYGEADTFSIENKGTTNISKYTFFIEEDKPLSSGEVLDLSLSRFLKGSEEEVSIDFSYNRFWLKFTLENELPKSETFFLEFKNSTIDKLNVFFYREDSLEVMPPTGDAYFYNTRDINNKNFVYDISLRTGEIMTVIACVEPRGDMLKIPVMIHGSVSFIESVSKTNIVNGLFYGLNLFIIILVLVLVFVFKQYNDKINLFFILIVIFSMLWTSSLDGIGYQYFWPKSSWFANYSMHSLALVALIFIGFLCSSFFKLSQKGKVVYYLVNGASWLTIAWLLITALFTFNIKFMFAVSNFLGGVIIAVNILAVIMYGRDNFRISVFFLLAYLSFVIWIGIVSLNVFSNYFSTWVIDNSLKIFMGMQIIFLLLGLIGRMKQQTISIYNNALKDLEREVQKRTYKINEQLETIKKNKIELQEKSEEITSQKELLEIKNKDLTDSLNYAQTLQASILNYENLNITGLDYFIFEKPKDFVSGDFFKVERVEDKVVFIAADCTGHGVSGALLTILGNDKLNEIIRNEEEFLPDRILNKLQEKIITSLPETDKCLNSECPGMDVSIITLDLKEKKMFFAGARGRVLLVRGSEIFELKGDRLSVGQRRGYNIKPFSLFTKSFFKGDNIYMFSDGYLDQINPHLNERFKTSRFKRLLLEINKSPFEEQKQVLKTVITEWQGEGDQIDDMLLAGIRME